MHAPPHRRREGMVEAVTFLIENGAKVGERDKAGFTARYIGQRRTARRRSQGSW